MMTSLAHGAPPHQQHGSAAAVPLLCLAGICKSFAGVNALQDVDFDVRAGEVHAVCGENGAGKSTLMKIMSGIYQPDAGTLSFSGEPTRFGSVQDAMARGVVMIHQELNLVPHLTVAENIYLAREPRRGWFIDRRRLHADAQQWLDRLGVAVHPADQVTNLSMAQQQMIEIAKALSMRATVLIMDEPTSSLTESETATLFGVIGELRRQGVGVVYISHRLDEMAQIVDRVTVLRDGRHVATESFAATSIQRIVAQMVGRPLEAKFPPRTSRPSLDVLLRASGLRRAGVFESIDFDVRRGEILGFAGLIGAGRTEVARAVFGADPLDEGKVELGGETLRIRSPRDAIDHGIAYLSEDRKSQGLAIDMTLAHNVSMANLGAVCNRAGFIRSGAEAAAAKSYVDSLAIRTPGIHQVVRLLSGGNQQKVVIAKWLFRHSRVLFFDEPTRGIDVAAKLAIYRLIDELAANGIGVVLISSELPEILGMTDRVVVFHAGRITAVLETRQTNQQEIMHFASGTHTVH